MNNPTARPPRAERTAGSVGGTGNRIPLPPVIAALLFLSLLSWIASYFYAVTDADVTVPDLAVSILSYAAEILSAVRTAAMLASVACFFSTREGWRTVIVPAIVIPIDTLFEIFTTNLTQVASQFNLLNLIWKIVISSMAFLISWLTRNQYLKVKNEQMRRKWTRTRAAIYCTIPAAFLPLFYVSYGFIELVNQRRVYSSEDYQAGIVYFIGILIREILVYVLIGAAAAYLTSEAFGRLPVFRKKGGNGPHTGENSVTT